MDVNFMGVVHGSKAAMAWMKDAGEGTIINVGSVVSEIYVPMLSAYTAAKHAVKGFTDTLRLEMEHDRTGINIVLVLPASINTPFFNHARSKMGQLPQPLPPAYNVNIAAQAIVYAAEHPRREIVVGGAGRLFIVMEQMSRTLYDAMMLAIGYRAQKSGRPDDNKDNLNEIPTDTGSRRGDFDYLTFQSSPFTQIQELHPNLRRILVFALVGGAIALLAMPSKQPTRRKYVMHPRRQKSFFDKVIDSEPVRNFRHNVEAQFR